MHSITVLKKTMFPLLHEKPVHETKTKSMLKFHMLLDFLEEQRTFFFLKRPQHLFVHFSGQVAAKGGQVKNEMNIQLSYFCKHFIDKH